MTETEQPRKPRRKAVPQSDIPQYSIEEARRIADVLADEFAKAPAAPIDMAIALDMTVTGGHFRRLTGVAAAYGLTDGAAQSSAIALTDLGRRVVSPTTEGDDMAALREAWLKPRVIGEFLRKYNGSALPSERIAANVIEELGVPADRANGAYQLIRDGANTLGMLAEVKGKTYVRLQGMSESDPSSADVVLRDKDHAHSSDDNETHVVPKLPTEEAAASLADPTRVFITHGSNREIVNQIKEILTFGSFVPVVSVEKESVAKPVPDKVMDDMRSCRAGIVHVGSEKRLMDSEGNEHTVLNPNVLIEIGAAMALYHRKFILLVERQVTLPSNLQGLYEVRYEGDRLDYDATMKLLKAFNDFRNVEQRMPPTPAPSTLSAS